MNRSRLHNEAFALAEMIGRAEMRDVPGNVAIAFLRLNAEADRVAGTEERVPLELLRDAITAFRGMEEEARKRIMRGWSLPPMYAAETDVHRANDDCSVARFLVIESFGGRISDRVFQDFAFDHQSNAPVTVHIREGSGKVETLRAIGMIVREIEFHWLDHIDHRNVDSGLAMAYAEDAGAGSEPAQEKSGVSAARPIHPTPASTGVNKAAEPTAA